MDTSVAAKTRPMRAPGRPRAGLLERIERALGLGAEIAAALLVLAEIVILFSGVVSRYVLASPLIWSDELASILFIWLAMLGAVVAYYRGDHMRMTALVVRCPPRGRAVFEALGLVAGLAFLALMLPSAIEFASEERFVETAAMGVSGAWAVAAVPIGFTLMLTIGVLRIVRTRAWGTVLAALVFAAVVAALVQAAPAVHGLGNWNLVIFFVLGVGLLVGAGVPIAFAFGLATLGYLALTTHMPLSVIVGRMDEGMGQLILLAVPLFVFLGLLVEMTGMARAMVGFLASLLGNVRGGLQFVLIAAMYVVSGISGSKAADMAAVAPVLLPEMRARKVDEGRLLALLAATGAQTETIPPSLVLITIGSVTGVSIAALFTGGMLPGLVLGALLCVLVWWQNRDTPGSTLPRPGLRAIARGFVIAAPSLALPFVIRGAVVKGVATATEVSTVGILYAIVVGLVVYRCFDWRRLFPMLVTTAALSGAILLIIGAASSMAWSLTQSGFSRQLASAMAAMPGGQTGFLLVSAVAFIVLGSVLEGIPAVVLFGPLLFPIARNIGVNEVHYAVVVVLAMGMGLFAPPFGVGYYAAAAISQIEPTTGIRHIGGYMLMLALGLLAVIFVPWLSTGFL